MLQVIGFADATFVEGEGPTAEEFIGYQQALLGAGVHVDGGFLDDYQLATPMQPIGTGHEPERTYLVRRLAGLQT